MNEWNWEEEMKRKSKITKLHIGVDVLLIDEGLNALPYCLFGVGG